MTTSRHPPADDEQPTRKPADERPIAPPPHASPVLTEQEAADYLRISVFTLRRRRADGDGPPHLQLGRNRIGFRLSALDDWLESIETPTSSVLPGRKGRPKATPAAKPGAEQRS